MVDGRACSSKPVRTEDLDEAVWQDVCRLLREPSRLEVEYARRLQAPKGKSPDSGSLTARMQQLKRGIARLIDAYGEGLLEKEEFEPKIRQAKERLVHLQAEAERQAEEDGQRAEVRLVIGKLEEFAERLGQGLEHADWSTRREFIRALVKRIEVSDEAIRIVYRVNTVPFVEGPNGGVAQDRWKRLTLSYSARIARKNSGA
jgi:site-specific DNA recombinase